jgi:hypothetical protein
MLSFSISADWDLVKFHYFADTTEREDQREGEEDKVTLRMI